MRDRRTAGGYSTQNGHKLYVTLHSGSRIIKMSVVVTPSGKRCKQAPQTDTMESDDIAAGSV